MKNGKYAIYKGNEYPIYNGVIENKNAIILISHNKNDIQVGFALSYSEKYMREHNFFTCEKEVSKSEITKAYKIETTAIYKTQKYYVDRASTQGEDMVRIYTSPISTVKETELYNEYKKNGFSDGMKFEYGDVLLYKYVSVNDPDLQIVEKKTEIDINKL